MSEQKSRSSSSPIIGLPLKSQQQEPRLTRGVPLPPSLDRGTIISALAFLATHHQKAMDEARRDVNNERVIPVWRDRAHRVAEHHQEQLYQVGEQIALLGGRNGYPRQ